MPEFSMTKKEFSVLHAYAQMADSGEHLTLPQMASAMRVKFAPFKRVVDDLRKKGFLKGHRKIVISEMGSVAHQQGMEILSAERAKAEEEERHQKEKASGAGRDPSAAMGIQDVQPSRVEPKLPPMPQRDDRQLSEVVASQLRVSPDKLWNVIKTNIISISKDDPVPVSDGEVMHVLTVMHKYNLDPFVRQMYAFRHKGKLQVAVAIDGWVALANRHDSFEGVEYEFPPMDEMVRLKNGKMCWPWVKATCHVMGRRPTVAYAFLNEWFAPSKYGDGNWEKYPTHRLKMKAYTLAVREALGIALYDEADREQFIMADYEEVTAIERNTGSGTDLLAKIEDSNLLEEAETEPAKEEGATKVNGEPAPSTPMEEE